MRPEDHPPIPGHNPPMRYPARCPARNLNGRMCANPAGQGTRHPGLGTCIWHKGTNKHVEEAWAMAQELAAEQNVTPHEALLNLVRTATGRAAWVDNVLANEMREHVEAGGDPLKPPASLNPWLAQSRLERKLAAATAKQAVDSRRDGRAGTPPGSGGRARRHGPGCRARRAEPRPRPACARARRRAAAPPRHRRAPRDGLNLGSGMRARIPLASCRA